jgi:uncharacterized membrane protein YeaQ/YmgE (transglycosylase-associated protein family)
MSIVFFLLIGLVAGWLAGLVMKGRSLGLVGNLAVGVIGSFLGGWLFYYFNLSFGDGLIGSLITAFVGAVVLLFIIGLIRKA